MIINLFLKPALGYRPTLNNYPKYEQYFQKILLKSGLIEYKLAIVRGLAF